MNIRIFLHIQYIGTNFHGWQKQPNNVATIQEVLEYAVGKIAGHKVEVVAAGRTDRGVHSLGLTAHFDTHSLRPIHAWIAGVNTYLPADICIIHAQQVKDNIHARFDAISRSYRYILSNDKVRPVILRQKVGWTFIPLDIVKMQEASQLLLGEQDFSSFRSSECQAKSPIKTMISTDVYNSNGLICFDFTASGFLHHMVRNIVGALIYVGSGKLNLEQFSHVIKARNRTFAPPTFMPDGLYLTHVEYPPQCGITNTKLPDWFWGKK